MRVQFLAQGNNGGPLMGLELMTVRYPPITSQTRYPLRHAFVIETDKHHIQLQNEDMIQINHFYNRIL